MKAVLIIILSFVACKAVAQTSALVVEEKSSAWLRVTMSAPVTSTPKKAAVVKKKASTNKPSAPKPTPQGEFEKTNQQVNRFKKKE